ncbi:hypothetical protein [Rugamonas sp.]|uniref:hypothetical protein n=1 Tax=Rugamonas sp. TaxID=1926287 RepID=UPI0025DFD31B|nr:hypothetical protein [Rugamonas sp.]
MNHDRELIHATMQWHALRAKRTQLNKQRLALEKVIWPKAGRAPGYSHPQWRLLNEIRNEIAAIKRKERTALNALFKVGDVQRSVYGAADVIDVIDGMLTLEMAT